MNYLGTVQRPEPPIGRNAKCPCGSGQKFKNCCLRKRRRPDPDQVGQIIDSIMAKREMLSAIYTPRPEVIAAMRRVDIHPAHVHAYSQLGFIVSPFYRKHGPADNVRRWDAAVSVYCQEHEIDAPPVHA